MECILRLYKQSVVHLVLDELRDESTDNISHKQYMSGKDSISCAINLLPRNPKPSIFFKLFFVFVESFVNTKISVLVSTESPFFYYVSLCLLKE